MNHQKDLNSVNIVQGIIDHYIELLMNKQLDILV